MSNLTAIHTCTLGTVNPLGVFELLGKALAPPRYRKGSVFLKRVMESQALQHIPKKEIYKERKVESRQLKANCAVCLLSLYIIRCKTGLGRRKEEGGVSAHSEKQRKLDTV